MKIAGSGGAIKAKTGGAFRVISDSLVGVLLLASGSFAGFVASRLIVRSDLAATSSNVVASELLFRLGIAGSLVMMVAWLFYALLLYRLLRPVGKTGAMTMLGLVLASVPIYMLNQGNLFAVFLRRQARCKNR